MSTILKQGKKYGQYYNLLGLSDWRLGLAIISCMTGYAYIWLIMSHITQMYYSTKIPISVDRKYNVLLRLRANNIKMLF